MSSLACADEYPYNAVGSFTNTIKPSIHLNGRYEVGLVNVIFPNQLNAVTKNDPLFAIDFKINYFNSGRRVAGESVQYLPTKNISGDHVYRVIPSLESDIRSYLIKQRLLRAETENIFRYDDVKQNIFFSKGLIVENVSAVMFDEAKIIWRFAPMIASILALEPNKEYDFEIDDLNDRYRKHPTLKSSVNQIYLYTDIVTPSRVGDYQSEILEVIPMRHSHFYKTNNNTVYKSIRKNIIENISILMKDERGRPVPFEDGSSVTCVLHIKHKE